MQKSSFFIFLIFSLFIKTTYSQETNSIAPKHSTYYFELLGSSGSLNSVNYDWRFNEKKDCFYDVTIGFGYFPAVNGMNYIFGVPLSINCTTGLNDHHFELGVGLTYNSGMVQESIDYWYEDYGYTVPHNSISQKMIYGSMRVGYKYQKPNGGLFIRFGFTPLINFKSIVTIENTDRSFPLKSVFPFFGLGLGYTIK